MGQSDLSGQPSRLPRLPCSKRLPCNIRLAQRAPKVVVVMSSPPKMRSVSTHLAFEIKASRAPLVQNKSKHTQSPSASLETRESTGPGSRSTCMGIRCLTGRMSSEQGSWLREAFGHGPSSIPAPPARSSSKHVNGKLCIHCATARFSIVCAVSSGGVS